MKYAVVRLGYDGTYLLPSKDLSKFLDVLSSAVPVDIKYGLDKPVLVADPRNPQVDLRADNEVLSREEYDRRVDEVRRAEEARRAAVVVVDHES